MIKGDRKWALYLGQPWIWYRPGAMLTGNRKAGIVPMNFVENYFATFEKEPDFYSTAPNVFCSLALTNQLEKQNCLYYTFNYS